MTAILPPEQARALNDLYGPQPRPFPIRGALLAMSFFGSCWMCGATAMTGSFLAFAVFFIAASLTGLRIRKVLAPEPRKVCARR